jgi:nitroimidazol reductase NimA-like FMN-containing flavoprotein (pyridoxamine 5'-phosphate oxidase superfamily)
MSTGSHGAEMTDEQIAEFLSRQGHGVLSFGGDRPYSLPISFGYDADGNRCIFQLVHDGDSEKRARLGESTPVSLVAYDWHTPHDWQSVVVAGRLRPIDDDSPEAIAAADVFAEHASAIGLSVFSKPLEELETRWSSLSIDEMSGYRSPRLDA